MVPCRARAGSEPGVSDVLRELGRDAARVVASARTGRIEERYKRDTEEAKALGVFGSPTFAVDGEVFWGDDRLEDAIDWFKAKSPDAAGDGQASFRQRPS